MNKFKFITWVLSLLLILSVVTSCNAKSESKKSNDNKVKITMLNSKGEIQTQLEEAAKEFSNSNPKIKIDIIPATTGQSPYEKVSSMYAAGDAPSMSMLDGMDLEKFKENELDLSSEKWVNDANFLDECKIDNKVIAFPFTVEGCGLIYNKKVLEKAEVDPTKINTRTSLEEAFKKIQNTGGSGCIIGQMDWSLGNHFCLEYFANKSKKVADIVNYEDSLKNGQINVSEDKDFNGMMATFSLMKKYNKAKNDPMSADYTKCAEYITNGNTGFYFQGNWTWPELVKFKANKDNYGYIPMPISDEKTDIANNALQVGATKFVIVDKKQNAKKYQNAAKKFLNWFVYDVKGQKALVENAKVIMAFKNVKIQPEDPLGKGILKFINDKKTMVFVGNLVPSDHWKKLGASYQKFLVGKYSQEEVAKDIENYWKSVK